VLRSVRSRCTHPALVCSASTARRGHPAVHQLPLFVSSFVPRPHPLQVLRRRAVSQDPLRREHQRLLSGRRHAEGDAGGMTMHMRRPAMRGGVDRLGCVPRRARRRRGAPRAPCPVARRPGGRCLRRCGACLDPPADLPHAHAHLCRGELAPCNGVGACFFIFG